MGAELADLDTPENLAVTGEIVCRDQCSYRWALRRTTSAIVLREIDGLSYRQVAGAMSCPIGTVRSRVFRAREAIHLRVRDSFDYGLGRVCVDV